MKLVTDNPNGLSVTFNNMSGIDMGDFRKVIIPKGHEIAHHVPVAGLVLEKSPIFNRVELSQDDAGNVSYTVCLEAMVAGGKPDFELPQAQKDKVGALIMDVQQYLHFAKAHSQCGGSAAFHAGCIANLFEPVQTVDRFALVGDKADLGILYDETVGVLNPMAAKHGGSFEIVGVYEAAEPELTVHEQQYLSSDKMNVGFDLVVFGACSGCNAFRLTYGQAPFKIAKAVEENGADLSVQTRVITKSDDYKSNQALVFK